MTREEQRGLAVKMALVREEAYERGRRDGLEQAAKIVDALRFNDGSKDLRHIRDAIRALKEAT